MKYNTFTYVAANIFLILSISLIVSCGGSTETYANKYKPHLADLSKVADDLKAIGIKECGENRIGNHWKLINGRWSIDPGFGAEITMKEVAQHYGVGIDELNGLLKRIQQLDVMQVSIRDNEVYFFVHRDMLPVLKNQRAIYIVNSDNEPSELYGHIEQLKGESEWWVLEQQ